MSTLILNNLPPLQRGLGVGARAVVVSRSRQAGAVGGGGFPPGRCYFGSRGRAILVGLGENGGKVPKDGVGVLYPELWLLRVGLSSSCCFRRCVWGVRQFSCLRYRERISRARCGIFFSFVSPGRGRSGCSRSSWHRGHAGEEAEEELPASLTGPGRSYRKRVGPRGGGKAVSPKKKKPWRVSRCPGSPACERGCVTDPLSAGYGERGGRSSLPLLARGKAFRGCLRAFPGTGWDSSPTRPLRSLLEHDAVWEFHNAPRDNASLSGRLETEPVDENKVQNEPLGAPFPTSSSGLFPGVFSSQLERDHLSLSPAPERGSWPERRGDPGGVWAGLALLPGGILRRTTL